MSKELMGILERLQEKTYFRTIQGGDHRKEESLIEQAHTAIQEHYLGLLPKKKSILSADDFLTLSDEEYAIKQEGNIRFNQAISEMERKIRGDV